jgi:hypothetical protein
VAVEVVTSPSMLKRASAGTLTIKVAGAAP